MTFRDLTEALARIADDPRIHPTTPLEVNYHEWDAEAKCYEDVQMPLVAIALNGRELVFSCEATEPALAR